MNFNELKTQIEAIDIRTFLEEDGADSLYLIYSPESSILTVTVSYTENKPAKKEFYKCTPEVIAVLFTGIINNPQFITSNTERPANVFVEYGAFR